MTAPPSPVSAWTFSDRPGAPASDASGNGNAGTVVRDAQMKGGRLFLPGAGHVSVNSSPSLNRSVDRGELSVELRVSVASNGSSNPPADQVFVSRGDGKRTWPTTGWSIGLRGGRLYAQVGPEWEGGGWYYASAVDPLSLDVWHHVAFTYDALSTRLYLDGVEVAMLDVGWPLDGDPSPVIIGGVKVGDQIDRRARATVDDVAIYDAVLSPEQIVNRVSAPLVGAEGPPAPGGPPSPPSPPAR